MPPPNTLGQAFGVRSPLLPAAITPPPAALPIAPPVSPLLPNGSPWLPGGGFAPVATPTLTASAAAPSTASLTAQLASRAPRVPVADWYGAMGGVAPAVARGAGAAAPAAAAASPTAAALQTGLTAAGAIGPRAAGPGFRTTAPANTANAVSDLYAAETAGAQAARGGIRGAAGRAATAARNAGSSILGEQTPRAFATRAAVRGGGGALAAMGFNALRGGNDSIIDQLVEGALVGGAAGSAGGGWGALIGAVAGGVGNVARNALEGDSDPSSTPAGQYVALAQQLPPDLAPLFAQRLTDLRSRGLSDDDSYNAINAAMAQIIDAEFQNNLAELTNPTAASWTPEDQLQLQLLASQIIEPAAASTAATAQLGGALYDQLAGQMQTPQLQQATRALGQAQQLGGQQLADAYRAQAQLLPQMAQLNANIAASYQQPSAQNIDLSAFGL